MNIDKIKSQSISIIINRGIIAFFSLLLEIVFIKYLTVEEKGEMFYIRSNIELFAYIFTFGLGVSIVHFRSKYGDKYDNQIIKWIILSFLTLIFFSIVFYNIDFIVKYLFISQEYFMYASIASVLTLASLHMQKIFLSDDNIKLHNQIIFYNKIIVSLGLIIVSIFTVENKVFYLLLSIPILLFIVNLYFIFKLKLNNKNINKNKTFFTYSLKAYLYELIFQLKTKFDNFLILYFLGVTVVGLYSVAVSFGAIVQIVSSSIVLILLKEMSKNFDSGILNKLLIKYSVLNFLILFITFSLVFFIVKLFGENKFEESISIFIIYSISLYLFVVVVFFQAYFNSQGKTNIQLYAIFFSLIVYLSLLFIDINNIYDLIYIMIFSNLIQLLYFIYKLKEEE